MDLTLRENSSTNGLDFNTALPQHVWTSPVHNPLQVEVLKQRLHHQLTNVLMHLFPLGKICSPHFVIGNVHGQQGESLKVELRGPRIGLWHDFTTGEGGDILSLWGAVHGWDCRQHFPEIIRSIQTWLGEIPVTATQGLQPSAPQQPQHTSVSTFGNPTGRWDYEDAQGTLLARVYRYDTATGKQYRPWDAKTRSYKAPEPRPLYNQRGMAQSDTVILVEGEKCAQALINIGFCATTAMNGAKAPLAKTDWSPLKGKHILFWPDNDKVGQAYVESLIRPLQSLGVASLARVTIPEDKPKAWDAADAVEEGIDIPSFLQQHTVVVPFLSPCQKSKSLSAAKVSDILADRSPPPDDLIGPRILTPGGLLVLGGAPKVGKTDLMLCWLAHMAAGVPFLGMTPPQPLKIFYLQTEILYPYLKERVHTLGLDPKILPVVGENLVITSQSALILNEEGVERVVSTVQEFFKPEELDVLVIDPLRNVFDGGPSGSENDNSAMLSFLQNRIEELRLRLNPQAGIILTHHTKKMSKNLIEEDPFQALSGAASLRSFYTTGMLLFRPDEQQSVRHLMFELRNGQAIATKRVDKIDNQWQEMSLNSERLVRQEYGEKLDAERLRRQDVIVQLIFDKAAEGEVYTPTQFCQAFEGRVGLGGGQTIQSRLQVLATKGYIKFNKKQALARGIKSKYGILCVEGMVVPVADQTEADPNTGEITPRLQPFLPTHFKESQTGAILPVENPEVWVYLE